MKTVDFFKLKERPCPYRRSMGGRHREDEDHSRIHNGMFGRDEMSMRNEMTPELKKGMKVESEHKGTIKFLKQHVKKHGKFPKEKKIYKSIVKEHLREDPHYYKKLAKIDKH